MDKIVTIQQEGWKPTFNWVETSTESASQINSFHDDFPKFSRSTRVVIDELSEYAVPVRVSQNSIMNVHYQIFKHKGQSFQPGRYRECDVIVGNYKPPNYKWVGMHMQDLVNEHEYIHDLKELYDFYCKLESIHPFVDGNGRVGGTLVAIISHAISPANGYWTPCQ